MKNAILIFFVFLNCHVFACGHADYWEGMWFYNLFEQTNISSEVLYPFLRTEHETYHSHKTEQNRETKPSGNELLWNELLPAWSIEDIRSALHTPHLHDWTKINLDIEHSVKVYMEFTRECGKALGYRNISRTWDYNKIIKQSPPDQEVLLAKANLLLNQEENVQLRARYYFQIIRSLHYAKMWDDAVKIYENEIENVFPKNEIYYYILDQVAGCYYSLKNYDKAAYLFTKVVNQSLDRKESAYRSFNFCTYKGKEGIQYINGIEDEKDLFLMRSLQHFSDATNNINKFIDLDPTDKRVELLFMRAINNVERNVWPTLVGTNDITLPNLKKDENYPELLTIAAGQFSNPLVNNKDFWQIASSYLSFINQDLHQAKIKLQKVKSFPEQKRRLSMLYKVFGWKTLNREKENYLAAILKKDFPTYYHIPESYDDEQDWIRLILDKVANTLYTNNHIAKAFLIHNKLEEVNYLTSFELLTDLENLIKKKDKSEFEKILVSNSGYVSNKAHDYLYNQKGIYFLYDQQPDSALKYFTKNKSHINNLEIPNTIFSNNTKEGFTFPADIIMDDEVYKATVFSFIEPVFSRVDLANNLIQLEQLAQNEIQWKRKLANYLLGNYYFNISNTGYYRGLLNDRPNTHQYNRIDYAHHRYSKSNSDDEIIKNRIGYNLYNIRDSRKRHRPISSISKSYYEKTIAESTDDELNARCLYLIAKCDLNYYYNVGEDDLSISKVRHDKKTLLKCPSYKTLQEKYSHTEFHKMILKECSYFRHYSAVY